jgi:hypothetical protein
LKKRQNENCGIKMANFIESITHWFDKWYLVLIGMILIFRSTSASLTLYMITSPMYPEFKEGDPITSHLFNTIGTLGTTITVILIYTFIVGILAYASLKTNNKYLNNNIL